MIAKLNKRLLVVWLVLSVITLIYLWIDHSADQDGLLKPNAVVTISAIGLALIKVRIIFREFMEVRHAPALLCRLTDGWVLFMGVFLIGAYFVGTSHLT